MRVAIFFVTLAVLCLSEVLADPVKRLDMEDLNLGGVEVLRKEGIGDDHVVVEVPKPDIHYYASEPVPLAPAEEKSASPE